MKYTFSIILFLLSFQSFSQKEIISIGNRGFDAVKDIATQDDDFYITGFFQSNLGEYTSSGNSDIFIAKYNNKKELSWLNKIGSSYKQSNEITETGKIIKIDSKKNVYVTGVFYDKLNESIISKGKQDVFLAKYNESGKALWLKSFGSRNNESVKGLFFHKNYVFLIIEYGIAKNNNSNKNIILKLDQNGNELSRRELNFGYSLLVPTQKIRKIKKNYDNLFFLVNNKLCEFNLENETSKVIKDNLTNNFIDFEVFNSYMLLVFKKNNGDVEICRNLFNENLEWDKKLIPKLYNSDVKKINVSNNSIVFQCYNEEGVELFFFDLNLNYLNKFEFETLNQLVVEDIFIQRDKTFLIGQYYKSFILDDTEFVSKGKSDGFVLYNEISTTLNNNSSLTNLDFSIYPNPNKGVFKISNFYAVKDFTIYDTSGRLIFDKRLEVSDGNLLDLRFLNLSAGVYNISLRLFDKGELITRKIIIKK